MIPWHVVSGMSGTIMVLPRDGLKNEKGEPLRYDRIFYVGENDFYIPRDEDGNFKTYESHGDSYADTLQGDEGPDPDPRRLQRREGRADRRERDEGQGRRDGADRPLARPTATRGPHLIGGHGDYVWEEGKFANPPAKDLETWFIRGGSAGAALYTFLQPGIYAYVNHNLIEAVELGATAHFMVEGEWNDDLMKQVEAPRPIASN